MYAILENPNRVVVTLADPDTEHINDFKKNILDSPAIVFEKSVYQKPKGDYCDSCNVEMKVVPNNISLPVDRIRIFIINNTDSEIITGEQFYLEYFQSGEWVLVKLIYNFNSIAFLVDAGDSLFIKTNLQPKTHQYVAGKYRIYKTVRIKDKTYVLSSDFEIM